MLPFKDGAFRLAVESGAPILPIAVAGTRHAMAKGSFRFQPARALATVLEPIDTTGMTFADIPQLKQIARERIDAGRRALARELIAERKALRKPREPKAPGSSSNA
jgi:1-acyl-sn-glycerol-3-phosphate acyltransferase